MNRNEIYDSLDKIETMLLAIRDNLDIDIISDDIDYADINNGVEAAITQVQNAMQATDHARFSNR